MTQVGARVPPVERRIDGIVVHCSATPAGRNFRAADIERWHIEENKWAGIGYHYVITLDGSIEPGRALDRAGAHVSGHNANTIGVCYVGGMDASNRSAQDTLNPSQARALLLLIRGLRATWPQATIRGHRDYPGVKKACPSFDVRAWCLANGVNPDA